MRLAVIIPAFNESASLGRVLDRVPDDLPEIDQIHIFVVDDGSADGTGDIGAARSATVLRHFNRKGLASAFRTGLQAALRSGAELIATVDADGQYDPQELILLLKKMRDTGADLVVGDRQVRRLSHMPIGNRIGNIIGSAMLRLLGVTNVTDASSGFRLFTRALGRSLSIGSPHTYTHEMLIQAQAYGFRAEEVPVMFLPRLHGQSKLVRTLRRHILRSCGTIVKAVLLFRPEATVLIITRSMQNSAGGMQTYMRTLIPPLRDQENFSLRLIAHRGSKATLPFFVFRAFFAGLFFRGNSVHLGDAALSPLLPILRILRPRLKRTITVYGLDLIWRPRWYQWMLRRCLPFADGVVAISRATAEKAMKRGVDATRIRIPCGIQMTKGQGQGQVSGSGCAVVRILLLGRQIRRKGTVWFLENVAQKLLTQIPDIQIVIAGDGPMLPMIRATVDRLELGSVVSVLGEITGQKKEELYRSSTLFVMPNVPVDDDMEGFGLVCIEAAAHGLPVVAAKLEGIADAVIDQETGLFFRSLDADDACSKIIDALNRQWDSRRIRQTCLQHFDIATVAKRYREEVFG